MMIALWWGFATAVKVSRTQINEKSKFRGIFKKLNYYANLFK